MNPEKKQHQIRTIQRDIIAPIVSGLFLLGAGVLVFFTFRSFGWVIFLAVMFYTASEKMYGHLLRMVRSKNLAAIITIIIILVVVLGPLVLLITALIDQVINLVSNARVFLQTDQILLLAKISPSLVDFFTDQPFFWVVWLDRLYVLLSEFSNIGDSLRFDQLLGGAYNYFLGGVGSSLSFIVNLLFSLILLFFFLRESDSFYKMIRQAVPISDDIIDQFKDRMKEIILAILKGNLLISLLQGIMLGIGIWICGVPNALLYGSIATVLSIIPVIGTAFVWLPVSIYVYFFGHGPAVAIFLAIYGLACYLILENILKPKLLDRKLGVHSLLLFFAIIGGLKEFGITGIILGPLILTIFLTIWRIYHIWGGGASHDSVKIVADIEVTPIEKPSLTEKQND